MDIYEITVPFDYLILWNEKCSHFELWWTGETGKVEGQRKDLHLNNCVSIVQFGVSPNKNLIKGLFIEVK